MVIDFKENIELLEKLIFNFVLMPDDNEVVIKPKNSEAIDKREVIAAVKPHYFNDDILQKVYREVKKFFVEYRKVPTKNEIRELSNLANLDIPDDKFDKLFEIDLKSMTYDFLVKYTKAFVLLKNLNEVTIETLSYLKTAEVNPDNIELITNEVRTKFSDKLNLSFISADSGLNFFNANHHIQLSKVGTPTGFPFFNKVLDGGWNPKTLVIFQGRPKVGKSMVLSNIGARAFLSGVDVGIATLELSDRKYMKRLGSTILNIRTKEYDSYLTKEDAVGIDERINSLREKVTNLGHLEVKEFGAGSATAIDIENYFLRVQQNTGIKFKVIIVDYLNLMRPLRDQGNMYGNVKVISEELRAVAIRNEWCIISATQIKREAVDDQDLGMTDVAESFGLIHTVDSLFGLIRGPLERRMKIKLIANRDGGYNESFKMFRLDYEYSKLIEETDPASEYYSDDDDTQSLEEQMRSQYQTAQTTDVPSLGLNLDEDFQQPQPSIDEDFLQQPPPEKPRGPKKSHDDILNEIS
jgi:KaiC/GvpD/RAD55 family RecA-like ATPase